MHLTASSMHNWKILLVVHCRANWQLYVFGRWDIGYIFWWKRRGCSSNTRLSSFPSLLFSVILLFHHQNYSRLPLLPISTVPSFCTKYRAFQLRISPTLPLLYPLPSLSVFLSPLFSPASFLLVARLLLLSVLFDFMPGFLSASAQSHKVALSNWCHKIKSLNNLTSLIDFQLSRSLN